MLSEELTFRFWQCYPRDLRSDSASLIRGTYVQILAVLSEGLTFRFCQCYPRDLRSDSGSVLVRDELVDVMVLSDELRGPAPLLGYPHPLTASVWATQADGSIGRTGSCRGTVK